MKQFSILMTLCLTLVMGLTACNPTGDLGLGGEGTPISVPTTGPVATPTPDPTVAPAYAEVRAQVEKIWAADPQASGEDRLARVNAYLTSLIGKRIVGWHAWVQQAYALGENALYRIPLLMDDPYKDGTTAPVRDETVPTPAFPLSGLTLDQTHTYHIGQEIAISGVLTGTAEDRWIMPGTVTPVLDPTPTPAATPPASDVRITLEREPCYGPCPVYDLSISGDGTVVYTGTGYVKTRGRQEVKITPVQVQELLAFFDKVQYTGLHAEYTNQWITDMPYALTSLTVGGQTHRVNHYLGDQSAPVKLGLLEEKIDEMVNTAQWITQGPDDPRQGP